MTIISDALRQAFMPKHEYESLREEEKAWSRLQRPLVMVFVSILWLSVIIPTIVSLNIVFPADEGNRPFCHDRRLQHLSINISGDIDLFPGAFYLTEKEGADYYWMVVFIPSAIIFCTSIVYLLAGITVAFSAPARHGCLRVVENNYCASKRGGVRCLAILNIVFAFIFGLLALFLGSSLLTLGSMCSLPLFWCYEIASWGLVILYGGTAFFLRRKAAVILDEGEFSGRNLGLEMLEAAPRDVTPEVERRVNEGFKAWMGSSLLSSDEEDEDGPDDFQDVVYPTRTNSSWISWCCVTICSTAAAAISVKDPMYELKGLRSQLHYAADYCEMSFLKANHKKMVMENTKEYISRAMVTVVDHLGSVSANLECRLSDCKSFSDSELRINCLNQRLLTCQQFAETLTLTKVRCGENFPRHHKCYISQPIRNLDKSNGVLRNVDDSVVQKTSSKFVPKEEGPMILNTNVHNPSPMKLLTFHNGVKKPDTTYASGFGLSAVLHFHEGQSLPSKPQNPSFHFQETKKLRRNGKNRRSLQIFRRAK